MSRIGVGLVVALGLGSVVLWVSSRESAPAAGEPSAEGTPSAAPAAAKHPGPPPASARKTASGLTTLVLEPGRGDQTPDVYDAVRVHFIAWNEKGKRTEDTREAGEPKTLELDSVIAGLSEGITLMTVGEHRRLWIPDALAYPGRPGPPRPDLVYDVELLEIIDGPPPLPAPANASEPPDEAERTPSGLAYLKLQQGDGMASVRAWDRVGIQYAGWDAKGVMFESSRKLDGPAMFDVADVMPGWAEALQQMRVGDQVRLWVPEALADDGRHGRPKGPLLYDIMLMSVQQLPEPPRAPEDVAAVPKTAHKTKSGLAYRVLEQGSGKVHPEATSRVRIHYSGWTTQGELFDSSVVRGHPSMVPLDRVIPGWTEGLSQMVVGDKFLFWIPEKLAYQGKAGGPKGMLVYEIELLEILPEKG